MSAQADSGLPRERQPVRILLIDDNQMVGQAFRAVLERGGNCVVLAVGGDEGIVAFRNAQERGEPFALVVTDFSMADLDGLGVAAQVKHMSPSTPVVLLTAYGFEAEHPLPANVDAVLVKPPKVSEIRAVLARTTSAAAQKVDSAPSE